MVHQPSGGFQGQATDIEIHAKEILATRARLNDLYAKHTGQELSVIEDAMERDRFLSADDAKSFGLIDEVVTERPDLLDEAPRPTSPSQGDDSGGKGGE